MILIKGRCNKKTIPGITPIEITSTKSILGDSTDKNLENNFKQLLIYHSLIFKENVVKSFFVTKPR